MLSSVQLDKPFLTSSAQPCGRHQASGHHRTRHVSGKLIRGISEEVGMRGFLLPALNPHGSPSGRKGGSQGIKDGPREGVCGRRTRSSEGTEMGQVWAREGM